MGIIGLINSSLLSKNYQINQPILMAEMSIEELLNEEKEKSSTSTLASFHHISEFSIAKRDLSFFLPRNVDYHQILKTIRQCDVKEVIEVSITDFFQTEELKKENKVSMSFRLLFQGEDKTLEGKEIAELVKKITARVERAHKAQCRSN